MQKITLLLLLFGFAISAAESILIDSAENPVHYELREGREFPGATGKLSRGPAGKVVLSGRFTGESVYVAALFRRSLPEGTVLIDFHVTALTPCTAAIRIRDAQGQFFQSAGTSLKPGSPAILSVRLDKAADWPVKWGGTDPMRTTPLQPLREVYVNAIRSDGASSLQLQFDALRIVGPETALLADFIPEQPLHLVLPEVKGVPAFHFRNVGRKTLELSGNVILEDYRGHKTTRPCVATLLAGDETVYPLPVDRNRQGVWRARYELTDHSSGKIFIGTERFGQMTPAGATSKRTKGFLFGVCTNFWRHPQADQRLEIQAAALCGVKAIREAFRWSRIQPEVDRCDYTFYDRIVDLCAQSGIEVQPTILSVPSWALNAGYKPLKEGGWSDARLPNTEAFRGFLRKTAEHYRGKIHFYEIMNEPDLLIFANYSQNKYVELLKTAYETLKATAPEIKVFNGGIAGIDEGKFNTSELPWGISRPIIRDILASKACDIFAYHGHGSWSSYPPMIRHIKKLLKQNPLPWYANETAVSATGIGERAQAETLYKKLLYSWAEGASGYNWYDLRNDGFDPGNSEYNFGLITHDFKPKAAYLTYNMLATHFQGGRYEGEFHSGVGLHAYRFRAADDDLLLAFWQDDANAPDRLLALSGVTGNAELIDLMGNRKKLSANNGILFCKLTAEPATLRIAGQAAAPYRCGELLPFHEFSIRPGYVDELTLQLVNPLDVPLAFRFFGKLPGGVFGTVSGEVLLRPGETQQFVFPVKTAAEFRSCAAAPKLLQLEVKAGDFPPETMEFPLLTEIAIPFGSFPTQPAFLLNSAEQVKALIVNQPATAHLHWKGPQDLSAEIRLARSNGRLLLQALVTDDVHCQPERGKTVWKGDNIQFALRLPGQNGFWELGLTRLADGSPEVFVWRAPDGFDATKSARQIRLSTARDEIKKQTRYEAEIPFGAVGLTEQAGRSGFRFNLIVNDNDGETRESFIMAAPGLGEDKDPSNYPLVRFR